MSASLRALLEGVLDYAGLFPPAQLPLEEAFPNYLKYRQEPESWMLGRFVIPVTRLRDLKGHVPATGLPIRLSVLAQMCSSQDWDAVHWSSVPFIYGLLVEMLELRVNDEQWNDDNLRTIASRLAEWGFAPAPFFLEIPSVLNWDREIPKFISRCIVQDDKVTPWGSGARIAPGLKLRCGGLDAATFPMPEQVAFVITACRDALVPLKFTAGLHHPIRHYNDGVKTKMHGFLNVFGAGVLAHRHHLSEEQVRQIIEDEDPANFRFDDECFRWKDYAATVGEIRLARQLAVTSFGSCSFDEPRDDLRKLRLL
jgi:hypothetical protein